MKSNAMIIGTVLLAGCGVANSFGVIGKNFGRMFGSHEQAVEDGKEAEALASGKGIVDMDFGDIGTAWQRVAPDGTIGEENYTLTYNELGAIGRRKSQLEPGTYFLNGIVGQNMMSGYYVRSLQMESFGWDADKKQAKCFSFTIKAGEVLNIPTIIVSKGENLGDDKTICPHLEFEAGAKTSAKYAIGPDSK